MEGGFQMIRSMTGFGRSELTEQGMKISVEMKSVNHRYSDISIKIPKKFSCFETGVRTVLKEYVKRGKVDVFINYEDFTETNVCVKYNHEIAKQYMQGIQAMADEFSLDNSVSPISIARFPEVFTLEEQSQDFDQLFSLIEKVLRKACEQFVQTRTTEGENLKKDLIDKLDGLIKDIDAIEERSPEIIANYRLKLLEKIKELLGQTNIDESTLATELVIFADKICVDEETVRLRSHIEHMNATLQDSNESIGRKLDFIAQEMNREANTILSKANDLDVSNHAINLKTEIEKIREQIQNIE